MKILNFKKNIFLKARLTLTFYYTFIMFVILVLFSSAFIYAVESKLRESFDGKITITEIEDPIQNFSDNIEVVIYTIDGILLLIVTLGSYFLAGRTLKPIKENMESQKKFLSDVSHDLRTPLAIMTTTTEVSLMDKNISVDSTKEALKDNLDEVKKMTKMVEDLLLLARGENVNRNTINNNLSEIVLETSKKFEKIAFAKNLKFEMNIEKNIYLNCDTNELNRVVQNLLQNSINFTKIGSIKIELTKIKNNINLSVKDTGVGIDKKDLPFIFDRFYKGEHSRNDNSGSGLGLSICKNIVENSDGNITIQSEKNVGTKVLITFKT